MEKKRTAYGWGASADLGNIQSQIIEPSVSNNSNAYLKVLYINARSLRNKFNDLEIHALVDDYDIIGITESWLDIDARDFLAEYNLPNFTIFNCDRQGRQGGGVLLYIRKHLHPISIKKSLINNIDSIYIQLKNEANEKIIIGIIYRPPAQSNDTDNKLYDQISDICCTHNTVLFGDFNLPVSKWGEPIRSNTGTDLYNNLLESSLHQFVNKPTRGANILDLVIATSENLVNDIQIGDEFSSSDHRVVTFNLRYAENNIKSSYEKVPDYRRADYVKLKRIMSRNDWEPVMRASSVHDAWQMFVDQINNAVNICIPMRDRRPLKTSKPNWWNRDIKNALTVRKHAHQRYKTTKTVEAMNEYHNSRRNCKRLIKQSKKNHEEHIANISKSNPKEFYSYIRKKKVISPTIGPLALSNGEHTNDEKKMSELLNTYFTSVLTIENTNTLPVASSRNINNDNEINSITVTESEVRNAINKLKITKSPGPEKLSPRVIKQINNEISKPLAKIFNISLSSSTVPNDWKLANVTPIFKKGDKSNPGNYRPISLTSIVGKLLETIIRDKLVKHLEENNLIRDTQHGFRHNRSCLTNLLDFFHDIINMYDEARAVDVIYLDFQKAFDKVPHKRLIQKLNCYGIRGNLKNWIENWLTNRKQRVVINGKDSE